MSAVARDFIPGYPIIHRPEYANDGFYGNGASWIGNGANSWLKIDLWRTVAIDRLTFGRDRARGYNDRDPGQFTIEVASSDDVYAIGADGNDATEYTKVLDSQLDGFSGYITRKETVQASLTPVLGRFVKLTFARSGAAIDEVEIFGVPIEVTAGLLPLSTRSLKHNKGRFAVDFTCVGWTVESALLNGVPVTDGQSVDLRLNQGKSGRARSPTRARSRTRAASPGRAKSR